MPVDFEVLSIIEALARFPGVTDLLTYESTTKTKLYAPDVTWFISFELERDNIGRETFRWLRGVVGPNRRHDGMQIEMSAKRLDQRTALVTLRGFANSRTGELADALQDAILLMVECTRWN